MVLAYIYVLAAFCTCQNDQNGKTFSFMTSTKKIFTLNSENQIVNNFNKNPTLTKENTNGNWYYVHFLIKNLSEIQSYITILPEDLIIQNTFLLFLTPKQIKKISNFALTKKIDPIDKFTNDNDLLENATSLIVETTPYYEFKTSNEDYIIDKQISDNSFLILIINYEKKKEIIRKISEIPEVKSITVNSKNVHLNSIATAYIQKNNFDFKLDPNSKFYYLDRYLNDKGLTGQDQNITIFDSLIDFNHAMFYDDNVKLEFNTYMPNHRKFLYYEYNSTLSDWEKEIKDDEHGTHVAGTAAGKSSCVNNDIINTHFFNGNAPDSKIIYGGKVDDIDYNLIPKIMNKLNSRISSNSYGAAHVRDNYKNYIFGQIAYNNPHIAFFFAAGNEYANRGNFSIKDPSGSKNVLSVGGIEDFYFIADIYSITSIDNNELVAYAWGYGLHDFWANTTISTEVRKADILAVNSNFGNQCDLIKNINKLLLYGNEDSGWILKCKDNIPGQQLLIVTDEYTEIIDKILKSKSNILINKAFKMDTSRGIVHSFFSSTGPANKGILKPDVMAPSNKIISAKSHAHSNSPHGCFDENISDLIFLKGTSMSCPNVAGGAALIHQYFSSGKWSDKVILDGATTRALIINSCRHPFESKYPDIFYGHGVVDLSTIIPIDNNFGVQMTESKQSINENSHVTYKLNVSSNSKIKKLQITLSYIDPMLNMDSPIPITHDLDLVVSSPTHKIYLGDHLPNNDTEHLSTNEKIIINENEIEEGEYIIHIYSNNFVDGQLTRQNNKQEFAVVASGPINNGYMKFEESSECPCEKCDPNHPGNCLCDENNEIGPICQGKIETIKGNEGSFNVGPLEIKRIRFISDKPIKSIISKSSKPGKDSTIWASENCHLTLGEYETNGLTQEESSTDNYATPVNFNKNEICVAIFNHNDDYAFYNIKVTNEELPTPIPKPSITPFPTSTQLPNPTDKPNKKKNKGSSGSGNDDYNEIKSNPKILGNFEINSVYLGSTLIFDFQFPYKIMNKARSLFGHIIPPPNFIHTAIWVGPLNPSNETLGAIFVYGKYNSKRADDTYLFNNGARSFVMSLADFIEYYDAHPVKKLKPNKIINLFDFINEVKRSGDWVADKYNWPTNNCQHFTVNCLRILHAISNDFNNNDWNDLPSIILNILKLNEMK